MIENIDTSVIEEMNVSEPKESELVQADDVSATSSNKIHYSVETEVLYTVLPKETFNTKRGCHFHLMIRGKSLQQG